MTRQPAAEKRFTVAWPMPRLAPVSSMVAGGVAGVVMGHPMVARTLPGRTAVYGRWRAARRGWLTGRAAPSAIPDRAMEDDAVMQAERPVLPELDRDRRDAEAASSRAGRGTSPMAYRAVLTATAFSSAKRLSSGRDCWLAQAPMRLSRGRD